MNNDLISRSAFIKEINEHLKNVYECDIESVSDFQDGSNSEESYIVQGLFEAFELIGNVPIAYNVDKVVEQIKTSGTYEDGIVLYVDRKPVIAKELVVEIVKSGGIE